ncbi:MAG: Nif3-like dinuclear metal center hexameric protein [Aggregatilineales bacterium]
MTGIAQTEVVARLDTYFDVAAFDERAIGERLPPDYMPILAKYAAPGFLNSGWNGLWLNNAETIERTYLIVYPTQAALDTVIAKEVQRGPTGALILAHYLAGPTDDPTGLIPIAEAQLAELREHHISYYVCHAPLDAHKETGTSSALAHALKVREPGVFPIRDRRIGIHGLLGPIGFHELAKRAADATGLAGLRYSALRHNGLVIQRIAVIAGLCSPDDLRAALASGADTVVTGEWWPIASSNNGTQAPRRTALHELLQTADLNLIGTSRYASESIVMRDQMPEWFRVHAPGVEPQFVPQEYPW